MNMTRQVYTAFAALVLYLVSPVSALATDAKATTWLNVRSGPGSSYAVIDTMAPGEVGNLTECQANGWCYIDRSGPDGWVSSTYLTAADEPAPSNPDCQLRLTVGPGGPRFTIVCGDGPTIPVPVPAGNRVCFYDGANYTGAHFCRQPGLFNSMPSGFNNKVSSVRLHGNAKVRICEFQNMGPFCRTMTSSDNQLGSMLNNRVSSFRVYTGSLPPLKQACLFDGNSYTGQHMCFRVGTHGLPPAAQNKASSVRLHSGASVRLSKSPIYGIGGAYLITSSKPNLPAAWNNQTRSVKVE